MDFLNNADYKLGDLYPGFSINTTRDKSMPDSGDLQATAGNNDSNAQAAEVAEVSTSGANKKGIIGAVAVIAVLAVLLGAFR